MREALTFDDVFIVPSYSEVKSRSSVVLETKLTNNFTLPTPIISAPMDSVTEAEMALVLYSAGGAGAIHRFCTIEEEVAMVRRVEEFVTEVEQEKAEKAAVRAGKSWRDYHEFRTRVPIVASIGAVGEAEKDRAEALLKAGANVLLIDVAHGDHVHVKNMLDWLNHIPGRSEFDIIAGNIATAEAAKRLQDWGADALRVGIGGGSMCTTRVRTGVGIPQFSAIQEVAEVALVPVIGDGGIRSSGDAAKALAAGADTVMVGSLLAGTTEAPGDFFVTGEWPNEKKFKVYRGSASMTTKLVTTGKAENVEGTATLVPFKGPAADVIKTMTDGIRSSMSYVGANNLGEFYANADFVRVTNAGLVEAHPHGLR